MSNQCFALAAWSILIASSAFAQDAGTPAPTPRLPIDAGVQPPLPIPPPSPPSPTISAEPPALRSPPPAAVEVTVAGTRLARTPGSAQIIKSKELERYEYDDPHAVLMSVPGLYVRGEDGFGLRPNISLRGVNPDRSKKITLMEDGVLFAPAPYSAPAAYYFPLITRMSQVRVIKGPAAIGSGPHTVGGAIDLITRPMPTGRAGEIDISGGEYGYFKTDGYFGYSDGQVGFIIEGAHIQNSGFKELMDNPDANTGFSRNEWMFKGSYVVDPAARVRNELRLKLSYSDETSNETYLGLSDADFRANPRARYSVSALDAMKNHRTAIAFTHVIEPSSKVSVTTTLYRSDFSRVWRKVNHFRGADLFDVMRNPSTPQNAVYNAILRGEADSTSAAETLFIGPNQREFVSQGIQSTLRWDADTGTLVHRMEFGARLHNDSIDRLHTEDGYLVMGGNLVRENSPTVVTVDNRAWTDALAVYAMDAITWKRLTLTPGVRVEVMRSRLIDRVTQSHTSRNLNIVLPGLGAYYAFTDSFGALGGVYRGFSPPPPGSDDHISPETSINYELGARFSKGVTRAEIIGFFNDYSNLTDVCTQSSGCIQNNVDRQFDAGHARIYGVEVYGEHNVPLGIVHIPLSLAYTLTRADFLNDFQSDDPIFGRVRAGDEIPYVPRHQLTTSVGVESRLAGGSLRFSYVSAMREVAGAGPISANVATDEQYLVDVSAWVYVWDRVKLYANIRNLLNSDFIIAHRPFGARPNAPRWVQLGAKLTF